MNQPIGIEIVRDELAIGAGAYVGIGKLVVWIALLGMLLSSFACNEPEKTPIQNEASIPNSSAPFPEMDHATNVLMSDEGFGSRAQAVSVGDQLALAAENKTPEQAKQAAKIVGDIRRKSYRSFHLSTDAREAVHQYQTASRSEQKELACHAKLMSLTLRGEVETDPQGTYLALYEASKSDEAGACEGIYRRALQDLDAYRGTPEQLGSIDKRIRKVGSEGDGGVVRETVLKPGPETKAGPSKVKSIETFSSRDAARVVIHLTAPAMYEIGALAAQANQGPRVFIDLQKTKRGKAKELVEFDGLVRQVRVGVHEDKTRVVFDLSRHAYRKVFFIPEPFRVVMDLSTVEPRPDAAKASVSGQRQVRRVVLDPGHGGQDPGAIGPGGLREKEVTLDIAHRAAPILSRELGIATMLTRDDDRYVALEERAARANAFHADLFVSIHCNATEDSVARGVQSFVLARAADEAALRLAARENAASAAAGSQIGAMLGDLQSVSVSELSVGFANLLQRATLASLSESYGNVPDGGVRSAAFFVLLGAQMPAVLFETSFISNPQEEMRLATADYRQKLADGIVNAIRAHRDGR